jgi:hypothetical protein
MQLSEACTLQAHRQKMTATLRLLNHPEFRSGRETLWSEYEAQAAAGGRRQRRDDAVQIVWEVYGGAHLCIMMRVHQGVNQGQKPRACKSQGR